MTLRLTEGWTRLEPIGNWPLAGEPRHATSRAYELLYRDLYRYSRDEVAGRSYLLAGHRGAGKTATVTQAILAVRNRILRESASTNAPALSRRLRLQRPLLVKLVGQSLIDPPPKLPVAPASKNGTLEAITANDSADKSEGEADRVGSALVHITIALYRALCLEVARGYGIHARNCPPDQRANRLELAAQLGLDLDGTPDPAALRAHWARIHRLDDGVLWPERSEQTLHDRSIYDQGLREIVAIATAAQAYQVCSGSVQYTVTRKSTAVHEQELKSGLNVKDVVNRLGALAAGGAVGAGAAADGAGGLGAVGAGVATWLLSSLVLDVAGTRKQTRDDQANHTFIRDRSIQTLDRELPIVIERVRDAGLAPVFVIDELDKLEGKEAATITEIVNRLKHLVSDYGFFCFLTNRDYFDRIESKVQQEAYPTEHTYFSERLLIYNRPNDLFEYLTGLVESDAGSASANADELAIAIFALAVAYRSKLNFTDITREVAHLTGVDDTLLVTADELRSRHDLRLAATIQLAVEQVLLTEPTATRFRNEPAFAQLAIDALYYVSRRWETNHDEDFSLCPETLEADLIARMRTHYAERRTAAESSPHADARTEQQTAANDGEVDEEAKDTPDLLDPGPSEPPPAPATPREPGGGADHFAISPPDLRAIQALTVDLARYLIDFEALARAVATRPNAERWRLADVVLREIETKGLIQAAASGNAFCYEFLLDENARPLAAEVDLRWLPAEQSPDIAEAAELIDAFRALLLTVGLTVDQLAEARLIPATITEAALVDAQAVLSETLKQRLETEAARLGLLIARSLAASLAEHGAHIGSVLALAMLVVHDAPEVTPANALRAINRHVRLPTPSSSPNAAQVLNEVAGRVRTASRLGGRSDAVKAFAAEFAIWRAGLTKRIVPVVDRTAPVWAGWLARVSAFLGTGQDGIPQMDYANLLSAARGTAPGAIFRDVLAEMTIADWSRLVMAALPSNGDVGTPAAPPWALWAGLRGLGFDRAALEILARQEFPGGIVDEQQAAAIALLCKGAPDRPRGVLFIARGEGPAPLETDKPLGRPILIVSGDEAMRYQEALAWLGDADLFEGVVYESAG